MNFTVCCNIIITGVPPLWEEHLVLFFNQSLLAITAPLEQQSMKLVMCLAFSMSRTIQTEISMSTFMSRISVMEMNLILTKEQM